MRKIRAFYKNTTQNMIILLAPKIKINSFQVFEHKKCYPAKQKTKNCDIINLFAK